MKYEECKVGMRVIVSADPQFGDPELPGVIERLHPVFKIEGKLPPGMPTVVFNRVSVKYDTPKKEKMGPHTVEIEGITVKPEDLRRRDN